MTEAEARALSVGAAIAEAGGPGVGTVTEKRLDCLSIKWTAPPTRVEGVSTFLYEDCKLLSPAGPAYGPAEDPMTGVPAPSGGTGSYSLGVRYQLLVAGRITALSFMRSATSGYTTRALTLYSDTGTVLKTVTTPPEVTGWNQVMLPTPYVVAANERVVVGYPEPTAHMAKGAPMYSSVPAHITTVEGVYGTLGAFPNTPIANMHMASFLFEPLVVTAVNFFGSTVPSTVDAGDAGPYTLGLVFKSSVPGKVLGARFYKSALNTGQHVANLWQNDGNMVAQAIFANETASGWQEVMFGAGGFAIPADTLHVVSVNMPNGHYAGQLNFFTADVVSGPLTAPVAGSVPPGNGRFYDNVGSPGTPHFPNQSVSSANYWVDVIFQAT